MPAFKLLEIAPLGNGTGALAGRAKLEMPSGVAYECRIFRNKEGAGFNVAIAAAKNGNKWEPVVTFASPELAKQWARLALECVTPHLGALTRPAASNNGWEAASDDSCPF